MKTWVVPGGILTKHAVLAGLLLASMLLSGCASTSLEAETTPGVDLSALKTFYVRKLPADSRGVERLIAQRLVAMGKQSTYGSEHRPPQPVDALVTYQDKWMWDITMYMLNLSIQIRDPSTDVQLASGHSFRTSLARRSPEEMVQEVLDRIFNKSGNPAGEK